MTNLKPRRAGFVDTFSPPVGLLAKVGSILVHVEEGLGSNGHEFDITTARTLIADPEVQGWLNGMRNSSLLPVKRVTA